MIGAEVSAEQTRLFEGKTNGTAASGREKQFNTAGGEEQFGSPGGLADNKSVPEPETANSSAADHASGVDEVQQYLWGVYQRSGTKLDSHGDFTWKDAAAAAQSGFSTQAYVIGGMDPDFREQLFAAGRAMDAAGIDWTILSGFRDDYRQGLAVGYKAQVGNSFHGGSAATGGYGHGCAVDVAGTDGLSNAKVWNWLDQHGEQFGLRRPLPRLDPAHVQPSAGWHELAATLREERVGSAAELNASSGQMDDFGEIPSPSTAHSPDTGITQEQYACVRPHPVEEQVRGAAIIGRLKLLITHVGAPNTERSRAKTRLKTAGSIALHRPSNRRAPETVSHHAGLQGNIAPRRDDGARLGAA